MCTNFSLSLHTDIIFVLVVLHWYVFGHCFDCFSLFVVKVSVQLYFMNSNNRIMFIVLLVYVFSIN